MKSWLGYRSGLVDTSYSSSALFQTILLGFVWAGWGSSGGVLQEAREPLAKLGEVVEIKQNSLILFGKEPLRS
jgi:hypothetical protein